ncbi:hypothetical protein ACFV9E_09060 [Streptomyces sp. NPDC059835]|uniref:hypothetical protein n=1 Tax=Streptomyces sp. NPDC059835 TaxID=3346967 RepID=UPI00364ECD1F
MDNFVRASSGYDDLAGLDYGYLEKIAEKYPAAAQEGRMLSEGRWISSSGGTWTLDRSTGRWVEDGTANAEERAVVDRRAKELRDEIEAMNRVLGVGYGM